MFATAVLSSLLLLSNPMLVSTDWMESHLEDPLVTIVEVGERSQFQSGHIPGARFIAREEIVDDCEGIPNELTSEEMLVAAFTRAGVGDSKRIVLYSRDPLLAARAWFTLDYLGHGSRASILDGGFEKWSSEKRSITTTSFAVKPLPFTAQPRRGSILSMSEVQSLLRRRGTIDEKIVTVDARPPLAYRGDVPGVGVERGGHLPDAVNIPWTANLATQHPPVLRTETELRQMYASAGIDQDAIVITYCRTGMEASMTYFVLRYLGYDATLFDGSFIEWSASDGTVVVRSMD
jgi:thiosulfate/3-mercaptopyruvate sulfurtransferase